MRGSLLKATLSPRSTRALKKGEHAWNIVLSLGRGPDGKYRQKCHRFYGTRDQAQQKTTELVGQVHRSEYIEQSKLTLGEYLDEWLQTVIKPRCAPYTYTGYAIAIRRHLKPALGEIALMKLHPMHIERYYAESKLGKSSLRVQHAILTSALTAAVKKGMLRKNVASLIANKPRAASSGDVLSNVWTADEAARFIDVAKQQSEQDAALFALALDSGARKAELLGLQWKDLDGNKMRIERQLWTGGRNAPTFMPPKRGSVRSLDLSDQTVALLSVHKRTQAELKMANRPVYRDSGLVFAQSWEHITSRHSVLGAPLNAMKINKRLTALCALAKVRQIKVHGLRHTCATLMLAAGVPANVVQKRLGHKKISMTLDIYGHVLPSMQQDAASRLATILHG